VVVTDPTIEGLVRKVSPGIFAMPAAFIVICAEKAPDADDWEEWTYLADCAIAARNVTVGGVGGRPADRNVGPRGIQTRHDEVSE
jgi:hypothetical protein